ncbi:dipeptidase [Lentilitoribacter sp. Alg239-R112]|uniref:dipeptidase n=1 Tax=Lentilitoribacter sp. Alg239-R112 TaxID=2305987 RepID=UPI0013A6AAED|nr:dipeptidase [Lentilitoribacter sp. Alg239-R112]
MHSSNADLISETGFPLVFDGHNDVLSKLMKIGGLDVADSFLTGWDGAIDVKRAKTGGFGGGFFAIYIPSPTDEKLRLKAMSQPSFDLPLPEPIPFSKATPFAQEQVAILHHLEKIGALKVCTTTSELRECMANGIIAAIMHIEGAEAIDEDLYALDLFYRAGLRSLGPVWSRSTIFGHGVPFRFPSDGDIGEGLTEHGVRLVKRCNELGILIDLSHLNEAGFWDVAKHSDAPLVATHSNPHKLCESSRNLTDKQLAAIAESDGMVGVNFSVSFLRSDGQKISNIDLELVVRHFDYLIEKLGEDRVGFGSDYDGAVVPDKISSISDLPNLLETMRSYGFDENLLIKLCHNNWLRVLGKTWNE